MLSLCFLFVEAACTSNWPVVGQDGRTASQTQVVALGLSFLFNHSTLNQNVGWERDLAAQCIIYRALRDIRAGKELYVILESKTFCFETHVET